jgi:hypothetical protein
VSARPSSVVVVVTVTVLRMELLLHRTCWNGRPAGREPRCAGHDDNGRRTHETRGGDGRVSR